MRLRNQCRSGGFVFWLKPGRQAGMVEESACLPVCQLGLLYSELV